MAKSLSVYRRRPHLIDVCLPVRAGIASYQFKAATTFNGPFTLFAIVPATGMASKSAGADTGRTDSAFRDKTRFRFDPADYSLNDDGPLWFTITPVDNAGVVGVDEPVQLVLNYSSTPNRDIAIAGTAPNQSTVTGSIEINMPSLCNNLTMQVTGTGSMFVAFDKYGPEYEVRPLNSAFTTFESVYPTFSQLFVRANATGTTFNANMRQVSTKPL